MASVPSKVGVVGAGTMGSGIAQLACAAGMQTFLHDPVPEALDRGVERLRRGLGKMAEKGRMSAAEAEAAAERCCPRPRSQTWTTASS